MLRSHKLLIVSDGEFHGELSAPTPVIMIPQTVIIYNSFNTEFHTELYDPPFIVTVLQAFSLTTVLCCVHWWKLECKVCVCDVCVCV